MFSNCRNQHTRWPLRPYLPTGARLRPSDCAFIHTNTAAHEQRIKPLRQLSSQAVGEVMNLLVLCTSFYDYWGRSTCFTVHQPYTRQSKHTPANQKHDSLAPLPYRGFLGCSIGSDIAKVISCNLLLADVFYFAIYSHERQRRSANRCQTSTSSH